MLASLVTQQRASAQRCLREGGEAQNHRLTSITACLTCPSVAPLASRHTPGELGVLLEAGRSFLVLSGLL